MFSSGGRRGPRDFELGGGNESSKDSLFSRLASYFTSDKDGKSSNESHEAPSVNDLYKEKLEKSNEQMDK